MDNLESKISRIKLVAFDVDGVLTNGEIIYNDLGHEFKVFNAKDGQGINLLNKNKFVTAIVTARTSPIVEKRAKELEVTYVYQDCKNKIEAIDEILNIHKLDYDEVAYIGDDLPDLCVLEKVGLACCPTDAVDEVKAICHFISTKEGGKGAVREICNMLLKSSPRRSKESEQISEIYLPKF